MEFPDKLQNPGVIQLEEDDANEPEFITLLRTRSKDFGVGLQLETLIRTDNKQEFVSFLKTLKFDYTSEEYHHFKMRLLKLLCYRRAIGCATALLNGETVLPTVDLNEQLFTDPLADEIEEFFPTPLRIAAEVLCYGLTDLFIQHGADPSCNGCESRVDISELPLKFALDALCRHKIIRDFPAGESVHKLFSLFHLQELKEPLDTIKLLASRTKQVINIGVCCVEEWNLVKLAALLMVASDKLVIDNNIYYSPIPMLIGLQHGLESNSQKKQVTRSMWQAFRLVEMSRDILKDNRTTSMLEDEVVPPDAAYKFLTEVKLHDKGTHMVSADLDRVVAELLQRSGGFLETSLADKKCLKPPTPQNHVFSADIDWWAARLPLGDKVLLEARLMKKMSSRSMDSEFIYFIPFHQIEPEQIGPKCFTSQLDDAMHLDDRDEFVKLVNGVESFGGLDCKNNLPETVRRLMFCYDSANCAAAVLAGETDAFLNFRDLTDVGWSFLHNAAKLGSRKLTALFLESGFLADDRRDCDELKIKAALPLNVALESIRDYFVFRDWKDNKSATVDLVVLLCASEFRNILETIRLLVLKTKTVKFELLRYLTEGKMIELCALLMVAHKDLLPLALLVHNLAPTSLTYKAGGAGTVRHFSTSAVHGNLYEHRDLHVIKETGLLLDIFGKIGDYLSAYIRLEQDMSTRDEYSHISWLIARAGISDKLASEVTITLSRHPSESHKRVLGIPNLNFAEQCRGPKLFDVSKSSRQAALCMPPKPGTYSSAVAARSFHTPGKIHAHFASFVSAKRLVDVLRRHRPPMQGISIVAALTSGFGRM